MRQWCRYLCYFVVATAIGSGCKKVGSGMDKPLLTVGDKVLTLQEVSNAIPANSSPEDSTIIADDYIKRWMNSELMLRKALLNLTKEEQDIEKLIEEYRRSLLVSLYQQKLLDQKYAPLITDREIENYYETMKENFHLRENIFKGLFVAVPKSAPKLQEFRQWLKLRDGEDLLNAKGYIFQYARKSEEFLDKWLPVAYVNRLLPDNIPSEQDFLRHRKYYETEDEELVYFVVAKESCFVDDYEPVDYAKDKIKSILLNKKRFEFIKQLEEDLYNEGLEQKIIKFH